MATKPNHQSNPKTVGELIDEMHALREEKRALDAQVKELETKIDILKLRIIEGLDKAGLDAGKGSKASASIKVDIVANVIDWTAFWAFIIKTKATQLLQHRVSDAAYRELLELAKTDKRLAKNLGEAGVESFSRRSLNLRSISTK